MFTVNSLPIAILFCVITMLGWGSWANTQKLAGKTKWPFELFYWDYAIGVFLLSILFMFTLGSTGHAGMGAMQNLREASAQFIGRAIVSGVLFNIANILIVVGIDAAGMSVAFPVGIGLALVIGTVKSYAQAPKGNAALLFIGVACVIVAMVMSALAHTTLQRRPGRAWMKGLLFSIVGGCLMGFFYPQLLSSISPDFNQASVAAGFLTPYTALFFFSVGLLLSNLLVNTIFMRAGGRTYGEYFAGTARLHSLGLLGGGIWMLALSCNVIASGVAGPAISYALGPGRHADRRHLGSRDLEGISRGSRRTTPLIALMFAGYALGLTLIGLATL